MAAQPSSDAAAVRVVANLRIVTLALGAGLSAFLILATFLAPVGGEDLQRQGALFTAVAFVLGAMHVLGFVLVRRAIAARVAQVPYSEVPEARQVWVQGYQVIVLVGAALAEGAGMLATVFYLLTGAEAATIVAFVAILAIALLFPSVTKFEAFVLNHAPR